MKISFALGISNLLNDVIPENRNINMNLQDHLKYNTLTKTWKKLSKFTFLKIYWDSFCVKKYIKNENIDTYPVSAYFNSNEKYIKIKVSDIKETPFY